MDTSKINPTQTPDKWVILKIVNDDGIYFKVMGSWAGGYLDGDSWKLNSGIEKVLSDNDYYYFIGYSGSCYKCHKKAYGVATSYGQEILNILLEKGVGKVEKLDDIPDWSEFISIYTKTNQDT